jgi:hypothetical protein
MYEAHTGLNSRNAVTTILVGTAAGIVSTLAQMLLWVAAGEDAWTLLLRDAWLTAALVPGELAPSVSAGSDARIMLAAAAIHFALSITYAALLLPLAKRLAPIPSLVAGAGFGATLYFVNLHGFTVIFPWFIQARGLITLTAHIVFGVVVILTYRKISQFQPPRERRSRP